ncbi:hypothetical protein JMJ77_0006836 [Colletotrichum scovillei]|uniref:Uncharacterized protein n=1 Tax=Colletotrichum scovillei TaxID=1209932 RepID=A0A9P7RKH3_9PEZI|nr:hypothetical protein JMJ77_0006836 [Colletotrichum scovillei]KAG7078083.1 hypothetical protein JMJ76_0015318 [Colletotrichum scovillei]KAG7085114.1 hypothetical protein JMJ78_0010541 [Colletotrichum scovillei]
MPGRATHGPLHCNARQAPYPLFLWPLVSGLWSSLLKLLPGTRTFRHRHTSSTETSTVSLRPMPPSTLRFPSTLRLASSCFATVWLMLMHPYLRSTLAMLQLHRPSSQPAGLWS